MDEQASFEARAVLGPKRARVARLALLLPVVALVAIAWAGLSGDRSHPATADVPVPTTVAVPTPTLPVEAPYPTEVIGLAVQRLEDVQPGGLGRDDVVALAGWYVPTSITDCPPLAAIYRDGSLPDVRGDADSWAFCVREGVLYPSRPGPDMHEEAGLPGVTVKVVVGVIVPPELEAVGTDATQVVVIGRFVEFVYGCSLPAGCARELVVDHVAWTPGV